ncbi:MAG: GNAT family N-acetyltransferase [Acidobacteriota bacterium]
MAPEGLGAADVPDLLELCTAAGWNQTEADWLRVMALEPELCLGVRVGGKVVATATATTYEGGLAWIGMVLTHPEHRGQGHARLLMTHLVGELDRRGVSVQKLDATDMGQALYEQLGFVAEQPIERWKREATKKPMKALGVVEPYRCESALDTEAFGWNRERVLAALGTEGALTEGGYALGRPGRLAAYFGPCVARSPWAAKRLVAWFLARHGCEDVFWDLLPHNGEAQALARSLGFRPVRTLVRMARKVPGSVEPVRRDEYIYAIAGFEFG